MGSRRAALGRMLRRRQIPPETRRLLGDVLVAEVHALVDPVRMRFRSRSTRRATPPGGEHGGRRTPEPIDIVYTWVDDTDPAWRAARAAARAAAGLKDEGEDLIRFHHHDELRYSLRSLWRNAGWFRTIHLVTAGQVPAWLVTDDRLRIVTHDAILPADALPTFNSHAIESRLHHIPQLAEHFIYLNDDVFIGRLVERSTFFDDDERPFVFPDVEAPRGEHPPGMYRAAERTTEIVERLTGRRDNRMLRHAPFALRRSTVDELESLLPDEFRSVARRRFRHVDDISVAASLAPKWAVATGAATERDLPVEYVSLGHPLATLRLRRLYRTQQVDAFCLNSSDADRKGVDTDWLDRWMQRIAPDPSPWERH